jgi:geranylgeranyl diphosphate synthase type II
VELWRGVVEHRLSALCSGFGVHSVALGDAMAKAVLAPGKRFRGTLILLTGAATGEVKPALVDIACALELAHTASLIFDDLPCMDDAATRRGRATTHVAYGESRAILAGIALVTEALGLLARAKGSEPATRAQLVATLAGALGPAGLCAGQDMDLHAPKSRCDLAREHDLKTGALFAAGFEMLATFRGLPAEQTAGLVELGLLLGRVFQSYDDLLDAIEDGETGGRQIAPSGRPTRRGLLAVHTARQAVDHYTRLRAQLDAALSNCPFDATPVARYTATVLPVVAPQAA